MVEEVSLHEPEAQQCPYGDAWQQDHHAAHGPDQVLLHSVPICPWLKATCHKLELCFLFTSSSPTPYPPPPPPTSPPPLLFLFLLLIMFLPWPDVIQAKVMAPLFGIEQTRANISAMVCNGLSTLQHNSGRHNWLPLDGAAYILYSHLIILNSKDEVISKFT